MNDLRKLTDEQLLDTAVGAIRRAVVGESQGGDHPSYDHAMDVLAESRRRMVKFGHSKTCGSGIYSQAYAQVTAEHAGRTPELSLCTCGMT